MALRKTLRSKATEVAPDQNKIMYPSMLRIYIDQPADSS